MSLRAAAGTRREAGFIPDSSASTSVPPATPRHRFLSLETPGATPTFLPPSHPGSVAPLDAWGGRKGEPGSGIQGGGGRKGLIRG